MTAIVQHEADQSPDVTEKKVTQKERAIARARERRAEALRRVAGIWSKREDIPADGLAYQRELRSEWR